MSVTGLYECAICAMRKKLKLSFDGSDCGRKKCKRGYGGACGGVWQSLETGVWQECGFSRREDVSTFNLVYKEIL
jgi:hypothetical protein